MNGLSDSLTIGILLTLIFGAVAFYLYSKLSQSEKRIGLLENLLLTLKMSTEASLEGPDRVEAVGGPSPLSREDVEGVEEEDYENLLKEIPAGAGAVAQAAEVVSASETASSTPKVATPIALGEAKQEEDEEELLRTLESIPGAGEATAQHGEANLRVTVNYEAMNVKELQSLARQRGLTSIPTRKRELIDALKREGTHTPLAPSEGELEGATIEHGFEVQMN
jgi:hypothetical protein